MTQKPTKFDEPKTQMLNALIQLVKDLTIAMYTFNYDTAYMIMCAIVHLIELDEKNTALMDVVKQLNPLIIKYTYEQVWQWNGAINHYLNKTYFRGWSNISPTKQDTPKLGDA